MSTGLEVAVEAGGEEPLAVSFHRLGGEREHRDGGGALVARSRPGVSTPSMSRELDVHEREVGLVLDSEAQLAARRRLQCEEPDPLAGRPGRASCSSRCPRRRGSARRAWLRRPRRQREGERAPRAQLAVDPDPSPVQLDEPLREREAEGPFLALLEPCLGLLELLEDARDPPAAMLEPVSATEIRTSPLT